MKHRNHRTHKSKHHDLNDKRSKHHGHCRGLGGPEGPMGPPGPPGISGLYGFINLQSKIIEPLEIFEPSEKVVVTITVDVPSDWKCYDLILSGELYADEVDNNCGVVISIKRGVSVDGELIGSQVIGYNGTGINNGIGFSGYHKEILNNQSQTGEITFCLTAKCVNSITEDLNEITIINRYIHLQAIRQK